MATGATVPANQVATTGDFSAFLKPEEAQDYFAEIEKTSIVQKIARKIPMGPTGITVPFWDGAVQANWIGETERKPITKGSFDHWELEPTKIAVIFAESAEVVRLNPLNYAQTMKTKIAEAIALAFDNATIHGINKPTKFSGYLAETTQEVSLVDPDGAGVASSNNAYDAFVNGLAILTDGGHKWRGSLMDEESEVYFLKSKDDVGRPLFIESTYTEDVVPVRSGRLVNRPVVMNDHVANGAKGSRLLGLMGDFSQVIWGQIGGLSFDVTDQATLDFGGPDPDTGVWVPNLISLWQHNMVAVRCEAEFAFKVNKKDAFVKLTDKVTN
ncbi:phage major capsid protein [Mycobacterium intracellulare]|uniref:Phage major capsid protein n=1 Tax=Mycobacterium intracellulare TaxID=1767 RepID=A0AAE4RB13_MYCIT|nr:phage major capsid protein [Mycobacterium intracellulare]MDV6975331.1 phage major capsid protein [Mycobacterium intracellulare]MDV6980395.1 phage major capsid protein [Mycobacterium intracellulare]MDV7010824.1 phage major capsid protein [Mycobacterium intracellulare]MDV7025730.1 phage major capsid protein [Mycobacterium intracellulare]